MFGMNFAQKMVFWLLRVSLGWLFFYAGITKVLKPEWSAAEYIAGAKVFVEFFNFLASPEILPIVNLLNKWGLTLLGVSLMLGVLVRFSSFFGAVLMVLYYLAALDFPHPNPHDYLVDEHIIYALVLLFFMLTNAGKIGGIDRWWGKPPEIIEE